MILLPIGQYAHKQFVNVKTHYPYAEIPLFVVMPNHIHAIVIIDGEKFQIIAVEMGINHKTTQMHGAIT
ncbi:MAG: hypothetical protein MJ204_03060 [Bacteroidales bacterium]|nr:hypothetical protein [Bacteroidales bacterium]